MEVTVIFDHISGKYLDFFNNLRDMCKSYSDSVFIVGPHMGLNVRGLTVGQSFSLVSELMDLTGREGLEFTGSARTYIRDDPQYTTDEEFENSLKALAQSKGDKAE